MFHYNSMILKTKLPAFIETWHFICYVLINWEYLSKNLTFCWCHRLWIWKTWLINIWKYGVLSNCYSLQKKASRMLVWNLFLRETGRLPKVNNIICIITALECHVQLPWQQWDDLLRRALSLLVLLRCSQFIIFLN